MSPATVLLLSGLHFAVVAGLGPFFQFENGVELNQTCGASPEKEWTVDGSVNLTPGDTVLFQDKVVITTVQELCTVDLSRCSSEPHQISADTVCHCKSRTGNQYHIHIASSTLSQWGMTLRASVQGRGWFQNMHASSIIGEVPGESEITVRVIALYTIDGGEERELLATQAVSVCPDKRITLVICVDSGLHHEAELRLSVDGKTTVTGDECLAKSYKLTSCQTGVMTFEYKAPHECTQRSIVHLKVDNRVCQTTTPTSVSKKVNGVCPDTPRTVTSLPALNDTEVLIDDISFNKSWIIFQRRVSGDVDFYRPWADYVSGFGELTDSFWLGLEKVHQLCNKHKQCELLINMKWSCRTHSMPDYIPRKPDGCYHAHYKTFWLAGAADNYQLTLKGFTGTAGNGMRWNSGKQFSTWDADHDSTSDNCARDNHGAWWYGSCSFSNLNARWSQSGDGIGVYWFPLTGYYHSLSYTEVLLARK